MPTTLPEFQRRIDDAMTHTWLEIRDEAIDNILNATPVWNILNAAGCMSTQVGGTHITRTISYGKQQAFEIARGDLLPQGDPELETLAIWRWRALAVSVQRTIMDDQENNGPAKIKDLVATKLRAARDALEEKFETSLFNPFNATESSKGIQGLFDILPPKADRTTGTYGGISRPSAYTPLSPGSGIEVPDPNGNNHWWGPKYFTGSLASIEDTLEADMKTFYNAIYNNQSPPNLIITTKELYELLEEFAVDRVQIIKVTNPLSPDLGIESLAFKGKPLIWSPHVPDNTMLFLNTDFLEIIYDPSMWFAMTEWKHAPLQQSRIAHILCFLNMITSQPRRHGRAVWE